VKEIYIYGASGHGLVVADIARLCGYNKILFIDDGNNEYPSFEDIKNNQHIPIAFGIGHNNIREKLFHKIKNAGFAPITLIHPSAIISPSVNIGEGSVVMSYVSINANTNIGYGVILNTASIIEHENIIESFVHISPKVALAGNVSIKSNTHIGIGSNVIQGLSIGRNCIIGAGSTVVKSIQDNTLAYGNPCKIIKELK